MIYNHINFSLSRARVKKWQYSYHESNIHAKWAKLRKMQSISHRMHLDELPDRIFQIWWNIISMSLSLICIKKESLTRSSTGILSANFISSGSKIVKHLRRRQYDPAIIEGVIGLVLGPFTALYRSFLLKRCTLTNKAVWTIWWALFKPPRRRQGSLRFG